MFLIWQIHLSIYISHHTFNVIQSLWRPLVFQSFQIYIWYHLWPSCYAACYDNQCQCSMKPCEWCTIPLKVILYWLVLLLLSFILYIYNKGSTYRIQNSNSHQWQNGQCRLVSSVDIFSLKVLMSNVMSIYVISMQWRLLRDVLHFINTF